MVVGKAISNYLNSLFIIHKVAGVILRRRTRLLPNEFKIAALTGNVKNPPL
jgi:hypothetical protein